MYLVDGGILSNFPSHLFVREPYPTIGFRIVDVTPPVAVDSAWSYMKSLLLTMVEAHDKQREKALDPLLFKTYTIAVPPEIPATKFDLTDNDVKVLYEAGLEIAPSVEWDKYSAIFAEIPFHDPNPDNALQSVLEEGRKIFNNYPNKELWVQNLREELTATLTIEPDWSTRYEYIFSYVVEGDVPLSFHGMQLLPPQAGVGSWFDQSLADIKQVFQEILETGVRDVIRIPAYNDKDRKAFVFVFIPPVTKSSGKRTFRGGYTIAREFELTLGRGLDDFFEVGAAQRAHTHSLAPRLRVRTAKGLPELVMRPNFAHIKECEDEFDQETQRPYLVYTYRLEQEVSLNSAARYNISLSRARS